MYNNHPDNASPQPPHGQSSREPRPGGNPGRYKKAFVAQAYQLARMGCAEAEIARVLGIHPHTITAWKHKHPEFADRMQDGKDEFDSGNVEAAMKNRALGYSYDEITREIYQPPREMTPDGPITSPPVLVETKRVTKHQPSDTTAGIFWLCNRNRKRWKQRQEAINEVNLPIIEIHMHGGKDTREMDAISSTALTSPSVAANDPNSTGPTELPQIEGVES